MSDTGQEHHGENDAGTSGPGGEETPSGHRKARREQEEEVLHLLDEGHEIPDAFVDTHQVQKHQGDDHHDLIHLLGPHPGGSFSEVHQIYSVHGDDDGQFSEDQNHILNEEELNAFQAASEALNKGVYEASGVSTSKNGNITDAATAAAVAVAATTNTTATSQSDDNKNGNSMDQQGHHDGSIQHQLTASNIIAGNKRYRKKYTWWWEDGLIQPILEAVKEYKSYYKAVKMLKNSVEMNADGRYDRLAASTVESWYVKGSYTELKEQYALHRNKLTKPSRPGQKSILSQYPEVLREVLDVVGAEVHRVDRQRLEENGSHEKFDMLKIQKDIRMIILKHGKDNVLAENGGKLTVSQKFIRRLVSKNFPNAKPFSFYKKRQKIAVGGGDPPHIDIRIPMEAGVSEICTDPGLLPSCSS
jgi:hypothetical protein